MSNRTGVVLAGGYARRFGDADKTLVELDGKPLIAHAVEAIQPVVDSVVVSCREDQCSAFESVLVDVRFRPDPTPDLGPLAGLAATLEAVSTEFIALAAADMPCVPTELYTDFFDRLDGDDAVVVRDEGYVRPTPGVYRSDPLRAAVERRQEQGDQRLRSIFDTLAVETIDGDQVRNRWGEHTLADVNTHDVLEELQR